MIALDLRENCLGFEIHDGDHLVALYRTREELPRFESPKPCFAPIYTPSGTLITEYRPADHSWHTGLFFGWVHVNEANLWGGPWYQPEKDQYEYVEHSHGIQRHDEFTGEQVNPDGIVVDERIYWLDADDQPLVVEMRSYIFVKLEGKEGYSWTIETKIEPVVEKVVLGASRAAGYSGLVLRMGPPFADAHHRSSEGLEGHENIMGQRARWVSATGATGGAVIMMDHPRNPRYPVTWFTRKNLLGAGLLMEGDLELKQGEALELCYGLTILDESPEPDEIEEYYREFIS